MPNSAWTATGAGIDLVPVTTPINDPEQQSPDYLTNSDKIALMAQYAAELATKTQLDTTAGTLTAAGYSVSTTAYDNAVAAISANLITAGAPSNWATTWPDGTTFGPVSGIKTSLGSWWSAVAQQRTILQGAISDAQAAQAKTAAILASQFHKVAWAYSAEPALPDSNYPAGYLALTTDNRTVQVSSDGTTWQDVLFSTAGLFGYIQSGQIAAGAITADMITAGTMSADRIVFEPGGQSLNGTALAELQADCTANHLASAGGAFPSSDTTVAANANATLVTCPIVVQSVDDVFLINVRVTIKPGLSSPWNFDLVCDSTVIDSVFGAGLVSLTQTNNTTTVPILGCVTGLSAGTHNIYVKVYNQGTSNSSQVLTGWCYITVFQTMGTGGGFNTAPIGGVVRSKPNVVPA